MREQNLTKIAFGARKGGVGKSTFCANIAGCLEEAGHKTLIVVVDSQDDLPKVYLSENADGEESTPPFKESEYHSLTEVLLNGLNPKDAVYTSRNMTKYKRSVTGIRIPSRKEHINLHIMPAGADIPAIDIPNVSVDGSNEAQLTFGMLDEYLKGIFSDYEYVLYDMPTADAGYSGISLLALASADYVVVPLRPSPRDVNSIQLMTESIAEVNAIGSNTKLLGAVLNMYKKGESIKEYWKDSFSDSLGNIMFRTIISIENAAYDKSETFGVPLCSFTSTRAGKEFEALTDEILKRIEEDRRNG